MMTNSKLCSLRSSLLMAAPLALATALLPGGAMAQGCNPAGTNQTCTNTGTMTDGIYENSTLTLTNSGTITKSNGHTIFASGGLSLINRSGGVIHSDTAGGLYSSLSSSSFNVTNEAGATIRGNFGIYSQTTGAVITNRGTITGTGANGIYLIGNGTISNYGTISGSGANAAVYLNVDGNTFNIYDGAVF